MNLTRVIGLAAAATVVMLAAVLFPVAAPLVLPNVVLRHPVEWAAAAVLATRLAAEAWGRRRGGLRPSPSLARIDGAASRLASRWLSPALATITIVWLAAWLPHYPAWPWHRDPDAFAEAARLWDLGVLPYRDVRQYNFPGHIYLHWLIGKTFGWGRPGLLYVADAAALLTFGGVAIAWSRRRFGGTTPGAAATFIFFASYLDLSMEHVAERDWHASLGAVLAMMIVQGWPGRGGRWVSAATAALAFSIRPHLVLFVPALLYAAQAGDDDRPVDEGPRRRAWRAVEWGAAFGMFAALTLAPLVAAGILDDLIRNLRTASYGGPYSTLTPARALQTLRDEAFQPTTAALALILAAMAARGRWRFTARAWLLMLAAGLAYRPLHPVDHAYLMTVMMLVEAAAWAVPIAGGVWIATAAGAPSGRRTFVATLAILLLLYEKVPLRMPLQCSFPASVDAVRSGIRGEWPDVPPGAYIGYGRNRSPHYDWDDYNRMLRYVRERTRPDAVLANLLNQTPLPPINGPTGRPSPFRAETGIAWMWLVRQNLDPEFADQLERAGEDSVVVWVPAEADAQPRLPLPMTNAVVRRRYEPEARFGPIEVWRRKRAEAEAGPADVTCTP